jgi:hypothetical protein
MYFEVTNVLQICEISSSHAASMMFRAVFWVILPCKPEDSSEHHIADFMKAEHDCQQTEQCCCGLPLFL